MHSFVRSLLFLAVVVFAVAVHSVAANPHEEGSMKFSEHAALMALVPTEEATHVADRDGSWFDAETWEEGVVPGAESRVWIPAGVSVSYDGVSDARLFTVRVDGRLEFATAADTRMVVDTLVVGMPGTLLIGTADHPVEAGAQAEIVIADNGPIDSDWDPQLLSRGLISHGTVTIHGWKKVSHLKVAEEPEEPSAGDISIALAADPKGWKVGDVIVLAGTRYDGYKWDNDIRGVRHYDPEDEVRTITAIDERTVSFATALQHDHPSPRDDLAASVANFTRNVTVTAESPETTSVHERGHVMFMHSDAVDVRYAAFHELGRTDKSMPAVNAHMVESPTSETNVKGRYSFHFHRTGTADQRNPAMAVGNAVFGSPGWGFVHHDSHAIFHDNASYKTFGAGFVAETGNETGAWTRNIAIYAKGVSWAAPKNGNDVENFDLAKTGDGFWFQGRLVESIGNIAASVNTGFVYFHRGPRENGPLPFDAMVFDFPEALGMRNSVGVDDAPILGFRHNETFAAKEGLHVVKANPNQGHDIHSHLSDFTAWSVRTGAHIEYTSHYLLERFDVIGKTPVRFSGPQEGISLGNNTTDVTIVDARIHGFSKGIEVTKHFTFDFDLDDVGYFVVNAEITGTSTPFVGLDEEREVLDPVDLVPGRFELQLNGPLTYREGWPDPDARKVTITGTKIDSLGAVPLPAGSDSYDVNKGSVVNILESSGYYETPSGERFFILEAFYSDRLTGETHKVGHPVFIDSNVPLHSAHHDYADAVFAGVAEFGGVAPVAVGEEASASRNETVVIDLLGNDSAPDGDPIFVDGIVQPRNGKVFDNRDGTVTYVPDTDFSGVDRFKYWVTDRFGNFTPATATVDVRATVTRTFAEWADSVKWGSADPNPAADPTGDGQTNLAAFFHGVDPLVHRSAASLPALEINDGDSGGRVLEFVFRRNLRAELDYEILTSDDLAEWTPVTQTGLRATEEVLDPDVNGNGNVELRCVSVPFENQAGVRYFRLRIVE